MRAYLAFGLSVLALVGCPAGFPDLCDNGACDADASLNDGGIDAPPGCDLSKDPKDSPACVDDSVGIFLSVNGSDSNTGTKSSPVATLNKAVSLGAQNKRPRIYACAGNYAAGTIDQSISVYGGFDCTSWAYAAATTKLSGPMNALRIANTAAQLNVQDLTLEATTGSAAGDSSIACFVGQNVTVTFARVTFTAQDGVAGAVGKTNTTPLGQAQKGNNANGTAGGGKLDCTCPDGTSTGGAGGQADTGSGNNGAPSYDGGAPFDGKGGTGGGGVCISGFVGDPGANGPNGIDGPKVTALGQLTTIGWTPSAGPDASTGQRGQGGGGGGARTNGGGGGGGCGGCGGDKGGGGGGGGASVSLAVFNATVSLVNSSMQSGKAGDGGGGGTGQTAQTGGNPGIDQNAVGCSGGQGGNGGKGGNGAGGAGGISVGILWKGSTAPTMDTATTAAIVVASKGGSKGIGGTPGGNDGIDGVAQNVLQAP